MAAIALIAGVSIILGFMLTQDIRQYIASERALRRSPISDVELNLANRLKSGEISAHDYVRLLHLIRD